ncbi:aspartyl-phosphate phosphatase Spo0E family protein [Paenibacillus xerothermodurans]|uniref:Aspartyl-phosphate phosphatase Spo0E family protein n=1 Tax=Paenibacillus xerothermodurans TaxID=1977292 RepID=A0A2W1NWD0_PAEXE|nr:aspartyl-phosphate phosphatase Spo0E family protein [Paenibacillus xerothermodurans]
MSVKKQETENKRMKPLILEKIEELRLQMMEQALVHGDLTDEHVVALSQQLDTYIVVYQKL